LVEFQFNLTQFNLTMFPWLHWLETCPSTNRVALDRAVGLSHGDAIFTRHQTAGRGQRNRRWYSPEGVITVSFVIHNLSPEQFSLLSFSAGLAVIDAIEILIPNLIHLPKLKWTNDILIHDCKVAGILCEMRSSLPNTAVIGIGLNRSVTFDSHRLALNTQAISLHEVAPEVPAEMTFLCAIRQALLDRMADSDPAKIITNLRSRDALIHRTIEFEHPDGHKILGIARGISDRGALRIEVGEHITHHQSGRVLNWH
jgi:BirA family transcriptional regulator, biotin operon repressor / biotin---[acetyl-CoA-carboxylase] ligase